MTSESADASPSLPPPREDVDGSCKDDAHSELFESFVEQAMRVRDQVAALRAQYPHWMPETTAAFLRELDRCVRGAIEP